jgi:hypothetical protein
MSRYFRRALLGFEVLERLKYEIAHAPPGKAGTEIEPFKSLNFVLRI